MGYPIRNTKKHKKCWWALKLLVATDPGGVWADRYDKILFLHN